jgi:hypothetical protein
LDDGASCEERFRQYRAVGCRNLVRQRSGGQSAHPTVDDDASINLDL